MKLLRSSRVLRLLYTWALFVSACIYLGRRALFHREYRHRMAERFGFINIGERHRNGIWIHAVSVGETMAAMPLVARLQRQYPDIPLVLSSTTLTGAARVRQYYPQLPHIFFPWDFRHAVRRVLSRLRPRMLILLETEIWPNLIEECAHREIPVLLLNARMSARSARRYGYFQPLSAEVLGSLSAVGVQNRVSANRFEQLGLARSRMSLCGNLKFDTVAIQPPPERSQLLQYSYDFDWLWVSGSTHAGEEKIILEAASLLWQSFPGMLLVLAPRHPERFEEVHALCCEQNVAVSRYSLRDTYIPHARILLLDKMGCLADFLAVSDVAYIGGSLVPVGGHNMYEASAHGVPVLCGPHLFNFEEIARLLSDSGSLIVVHNATELAREISSLLDDGAKRELVARAAVEALASQGGALDKHMELLAPFLR